MNIYTILTPIITSLIIFCITTVFYQPWKENRRDKRKEKYNLLTVLMKHRREIVEAIDNGMSDKTNNEVYQAINLIDLVFYKCSKVTSACRQYHDILISFEGRDKSQDLILRTNGEYEKIKSDYQAKFYELMKVIASDLRYDFDIEQRHPISEK